MAEAKVRKEATILAMQEESLTRQKQPALEALESLRRSGSTSSLEELQPHSELETIESSMQSEWKRGSLKVSQAGDYTNVGEESTTVTLENKWASFRVR